MASAPQSPSPSRSSLALTVAVVLACFLIFAGIVTLTYWNNRDTTLTPDLTKVDEADRWKYSVDGRAARLAELRGKELTVATTYGWVDQPAGIVRVPVARAMELVVQEQGAKN